MSKLQQYLAQKASCKQEDAKTVISIVSMDDILHEVDNISTLPAIAMQVIELASNPESGAGDLKKVMESDATLAARVLRCVNSSAYASRSSITNLQQAIAYIGLKQIRNLALTASVSDLFKEEETIGTYQRSLLWRHMVSVGLCARLIAMRRKFENFEDIFMAGLLHDIGIVLQDQYAHEQFCKVMHSLDSTRTFVEVEKECMGFSHDELGARVAEKWKFPKLVVDTIRYHHSSDKYSGEYIDVVRCVEVANLICTLKGISAVGMKLLEKAQSAMVGLSLGEEDVLILAKDLDEEIKQQADLFGV